ncbi:MAG: plasmid partitioning protein RepB, partial [Pseudomonadota bacterium]|nr:plasmid partitioning protein RepB [Pseudomonadota bacterium]
MSRKDTLRALLSDRHRELPDGNSGGSADETGVSAAALASFVRTGAVGAMGRSLGRIAAAAEDARALLSAGDAVVELAVNLIEPSFLADRFDEDPASHQTLVASIRDSGQQAPILLRPHPEKPGHYQVAYGHRRLKAVAALGRPVRAVVREMSDAELVLAQGQENSARMDLSYIERAQFAAALED